jgi:Putative addiction module component
MKITLEVNDTNKAGLLVEFLKSLNYVNVKEPKTRESLPDWHIAIIQKRLIDLKSNPGKAIDFDKALEQIESEL